MYSKNFIVRRKIQVHFYDEMMVFADVMLDLNNKSHSFVCIQVSCDSKIRDYVGDPKVPFE